MTQPLPYITIGAIFGAIHGIILWAAKTTFSSVLVPASHSLEYSSFFISPLVPAFTPEEVFFNSLLVTGAADAIFVITIVSAVWWLPKLEQLFFQEE